MNNIQFVKRSTRESPKISLILLDWSVRESFHLFHYLRKQTVTRDAFEVTVIEYYSRVSDSLREFEDMVDNWIVMGMPEDCYYHKHLMYNVGIAFSHGEVIMIGDSDAMVKETFLETILNAFEDNPNIVFHMDQFRNMRRGLYPFSYPSFDEVLGEGCINNTNGQTSGLLNTQDPLHTRNYGACMCARREDLIAIGGADEHIDYLGHICGPYDMTFRLVNLGRREIWSDHEFMYHTWHPGQAGADNYLGPHDGRHMSTTALEALETGRITPYNVNPILDQLKKGEKISQEKILQTVINSKYLEEWKIENIKKNTSHTHWNNYAVPLGFHNGFIITAEVDRLIARPIKGIPGLAQMESNSAKPLDDSSLSELRKRIDDIHPKPLMSAITQAAKGFHFSFSVTWVGDKLKNLLALPYRVVRNRTKESLIDCIKGVVEFTQSIPHFAGELRELILATQGQFGSLAIAIYYLTSGTNSSKTPSPIVLIRHEFTRQLLENLKKNPDFPSFEIHFGRDTVQVNDLIDKLGHQRPEAKILVWGELYTLFHEAFNESHARDRIIVI